jgi:hypothetical protein
MFHLAEAFHTDLASSVVQLRSKIASATSAIKSVFGQEVQQQDAVSSFCSSSGTYFFFTS